MAFWNPLSWKRETKASAAGPVYASMIAGQPVWTERDYKAFAKEAYTQNAIAFRAMSMVAQAVALSPMLLRDSNGDVIETAPVLDLLNRPAPGYTYAWLMESLATYLQLAGNSYLESVGPDRVGAPPQELWSLRPDRMQVIAGLNGMPQGYRYEAGGQHKNWAVDPLTGQSDILHIKRFSPTSDWYGMSLVEPAAFAVDRHNEAGAHNMAVLQNGATPSGAMIFKSQTANGQTVSAPIDVIKAAEKALADRYSGTRNAGRPMVLGGDIDWVQFGMSMEQLQLTESKLDAARDICAAFGVPIELLLPGQSTYNNRREAKLSFYEETVLPMLGMIVDHLNIWLLPRFDGEMHLEPDLDGMEALSLRREIRQKNTRELYNDGLISRDEGRKALQFEPEPDMPQHKVDSMVLNALVNTAMKDGMMFLPLFNYLRSVGLIPRDMSIDKFVTSNAGLFDGISSEEAAAALVANTNSSN